MRLLQIRYDDAVDISIIPKGTVVTISDGTNSLSDGKVMSLTDMEEPEVVDHRHLVVPETSPPVPIL